ncbi:hypothetical protein [Acidithiobacillus sp.]|uniref:hypothetical protein n=1 Tax=Acidithiobacillus sp. TaxID=1872118 RepID=UPI00230F1E9A|nr:hypothetical protein [Acidithiobacillus sp.]MDA8246952.1 hypothetical protein [Acidithiobacillus sp.]
MKIQAFGVSKTPAQLYQDRKDRESAIRSDKKYGIVKMIQWVKEQDWKDAHPKPMIIRNKKVVRMAPRTPRARRNGEGSRSSAASGDGNSDSDDSDPERRAQPLSLHDQASLAGLLKISKKSVQNVFSKTPWLLPVAISIPGARGPRWTPQAVQAWLNDRPAHTVKPALQAAARNKVGRPRIALAVQGGAA